MRTFVAPNLFVIGAAKAASTSLHRWLGDHPAIGIGIHDESRYLMDAEDRLSRSDGYAARGLNGYMRDYPDQVRGADCRYLLDVTPMYYYQHTAREVIAALPERQVIFTVRQPSARIRSLFNYARNNIGVLPKSLGFAEFAQELERGTASKLLAGHAMLLQARRHCEYARYIEEWRNLVGAENLHVLIFEELVADPRKTLRDLAGLLGISPGFYDGYHFVTRNDSYEVSNMAVHRAVRRLRPWLPSWARLGLGAAYRQMNTAPITRGLSAEDRAAMRRIDEEFRDWNASLATALGRPDPIWPEVDLPLLAKTAEAVGEAPTSAQQVAALG